MTKHSISPEYATEKRNEVLSKQRQRELLYNGLYVSPIILPQMLRIQREMSRQAHIVLLLGCCACL